MRELYPPILPSYMPAFDYKSSDVKVYFQFSPYMTNKAISNAEIVVRYQVNNNSALNDPTEIKTVSIDPNDDSIKINANDLKNGFEENVIYKLQMRLVAGSEKSEWSTVCLLKPIQPPTLSCLQFPEADNVEDSSELNLTLSATDAIFNGVYKIDSTSDEVLRSYRLKLYQKKGSEFELIKDSNEIIFNSYDFTSTIEENKISFPFEYNFKMQLYEDEEYYLTINAESKNGYPLEKKYLFSVIQVFSDDFNPTLEIKPNYEDGYMVISIQEDAVRNQRFTLCRSSSESNFEVWDDINNYRIEGSTTDITYYDFTIQSGICYQYAVQARDNLNRRGKLIKSNKAISEFEYSYLLGQNGDLDTVQQLRISYNVELSSYNVSVMENKIDTIGSKYPYVVRNGIPYYKSFSINGLISYHMDENELFCSREKDQPSLYEDYDQDKIDQDQGVMNLEDNKYPSSYNPYYDTIYEKIFRDKVIDFLYNNKIKLFKSSTEGNILIKLMDISFNPVNELGRMLYNFSATAYEIDDYCVDNLIKYDILTVDYTNPIVSFGKVKLGQFNSFDTFFNKDWNLKTNIIKKYDNQEKAIGNTVVDATLSYLKITFESSPYLIDGQSMTPIEDTTMAQFPLSGWIINNNGTKILVSYPNNIYEIKGDNIEFSANISFPKECSIEIDYIANLTIEPTNDKYVSQKVYNKVIGQLFKVFNPYSNFIFTIYNKYFYEDDAQQNKITGIYSLDIEAEPNTVLYVKTKNEDILKRYVINFTGNLFLQLDSTEDDFKEAYFKGVSVESSKINLLPSKPNNPLTFDAYVEDGKTYVWYNNSWAVAELNDDDTYDIICNVNGIVNYHLQLVRSTYS